MNYLKHLGRYEVVAFVTGFGLLSYELAGARVLAPYIGASTYVWSSVIGVIIAALSLGFFTGGWLADKRSRVSDLAWLLLMAAAGVAVTLALSDAVLQAVSGLGDPRAQGLVASLLLFAPTSFLIGVTSPYLAKLRIKSLSTTGRSVAGLDAVNAIGGIAGTFATGFIFFGYVGARETMILIVVLLLFASWLLADGVQIKKRLVATAVIALGVALFWTPTTAAGVAATIDTASATYRVLDIGYEGVPVRVLTSGPGGYQSGVYAGGRADLVFDYTRKIAEVVAALPARQSILVLGGGAFSLPQYFAERYPSASIDVVEVDPELEAIAKQYFGYQDVPNMHVINQDARAFLNQNQQRYDVVVVDVFSDTEPPFNTTTKEFSSVLKRAVQPGGVVIVNVIAGDTSGCRQLLGGLHASYKSAFDVVAVFPLSDASLSSRQNIILAYSNQQLDLRVVPGRSNVSLPKAAAFTDSYAPIERLHHHCLKS